MIGNSLFQNKYRYAFLAVTILFIFTIAQRTYVGKVDAHGSNPDLIHSCLSPAGLIRIIDPSSSCLTGEDPLDWNGVIKKPAFKAQRNSSQSIPNATVTKLSYNNEVFDTESDYDPSNARWTPSVSGKYLVHAVVRFSGGAGAGTNVSLILQKNGSDEAVIADTEDGTNSFEVSTIVDMNGSTDYIEAFVYQDSGVSKNTVATATTIYFEGSKID